MPPARYMTDIVKCSDGKSCQSGNCTSTSTCPAGQTLCNGACADLNTDFKNCGTCGKVVCLTIPPARYVWILLTLLKCSNGETCQSGNYVLTCSTEQTLCNGACTDIKIDSKNCGVCGKEVCVTILPDQYEQIQLTLL